MYIGWLNISVKFCFEIPSDCWENCKKSYVVNFLPHPVHWASAEAVNSLYFCSVLPSHWSTLVASPLGRGGRLSLRNYRTQKWVRGVQPPIESLYFFELCVWKIYRLSSAHILIKFYFLQENVQNCTRISHFASASPRPPAGALPLDPTGRLPSPRLPGPAPTTWTPSVVISWVRLYALRHNYVCVCVCVCVCASCLDIWLRVRL